MHECGRPCRGRRALQEATERLNRAMERADADSQRGRRGPRGTYHPTNGHKEDHEGVHRISRTAEHDYDRWTSLKVRVFTQQMDKWQLRAGSCVSVMPHACNHCSALYCTTLYAAFKHTAK